MANTSSKKRLNKHEMSDTESGDNRPEWLRGGDPEESTPIAGEMANPSSVASAQSASGEHWLLRFQHRAGVLSHILALIAVCVVSGQCVGIRRSNGRRWCELV
jgi:hypothetical protein